MAFNGSGVFSRIYNWIQDRDNGIRIRALRMDEEMDGFATGLSNCITKDGQTVIAQNIPFNGKKITGLGDATADTDALNRITGDGRYLAVGSVANTTIDERVRIGTVWHHMDQYADSSVPVNFVAIPMDVLAMAPKSILTFELYNRRMWPTVDAALHMRVSDTGDGTDIVTGYNYIGSQSGTNQTSYQLTGTAKAGSPIGGTITYEDDDTISSRMWYFKPDGTFTLDEIHGYVGVSTPNYLYLYFSTGQIDLYVTELYVRTR